MKSKLHTRPGGHDGRREKTTTREERKTEIEVIKSHLTTVLEDLVENKYKLEELRAKQEARKLEMIAGDLYRVLGKLEAKL